MARDKSSKPEKPEKPEKQQAKEEKQEKPEAPSNPGVAEKVEKAMNVFSKWQKIKDFFDGMADVLGVLASIPLIAAIFERIFGRTPKGKRETSKPKEAPANGEAPEIRFGGTFDYSDEIGLAKLFAELANEPDYADAPENISAYLNKLKKWQRNRFRVIVGNLGLIRVQRTGTETKRTAIEKTTQRHHGAPNTERHVIEEKEKIISNSGIEFLKLFSKADDAEKKKMCQAIGVFDNPLESMEKTLKKARKWLRAHEEDIYLAVNAATIRLQTFNGGPYRGFVRTPLFRGGFLRIATRIFLAGLLAVIVFGLATS